MESYTRDFYEMQKDGSRRSAREIVPLVMDLLQPKSVVDVGCGVGTWLSIFRECGVQDILGIDGEWVDKKQIQIPLKDFIRLDLTKPIRRDRQFDLVVSLEVAEHLPSVHAKVFVDSLTRLGPVVMFSAAIPSQGGENHVNEQWPDYWVKHFSENDYLVIDTLRQKVWENEKVEFWYAQNILLFVHRDYLNQHSSLTHEFDQTKTTQLRLVHPKMYLEVTNWRDYLYLMANDLSTVMAPDDSFVLVDEDNFRPLIALMGSRRILPFPEKEGQYWGRPADSEEAIREFERLRLSGARFMVFAQPAFWWLEYYSGFRDHLEANFSRVLSNNRVIVFRLNSVLPGDVR